MASYRLNNAAVADLDGIYEYGILTFGMKRADEYYDGFTAHFEIIADSPLSFPAVDEIRAGFRRAPYNANSIYYRIDGDTVEIMRVLGRQDTRRIFK